MPGAAGDDAARGPADGSGGGDHGRPAPRHLGHPRRRPRLLSAHDHPEHLLASCYADALRVADELGARTVAFPAISCGIYGYPLEEAAPIAITAVRAADTSVDVVRFVLFDRASYDAFASAAASLA